MEGGFRKIRVSDQAMDEIAKALGLTVQWGEPDEDGFYDPSFVRVADRKVVDRNEPPDPDWCPDCKHDHIAGVKCRTPIEDNFTPENDNPAYVCSCEE